MNDEYPSNAGQRIASQRWVEEAEQNMENGFCTRPRDVRASNTKRSCRRPAISSTDDFPAAAQPQPQRLRLRTR